MLPIPFLAALLVQPPATRPVDPVLAFPEPGLDDSAAYQGYQTRLFRDAAGNTLQLYLDGREGRVVHLWADAEDESVGFSARDDAGRPAALRFAERGARVGAAGRWRSFEHRLVADGRTVRLGLALLGSMRVERDLQYSGRQRAPLGERAFPVAEVERMLTAMERLPGAERRRHLALLGATGMPALYARLEPKVAVTRGAGGVTARFVQPSLDARDTITLEVRADPRVVTLARDGRALTLRAVNGAATAVPFTVRVATTGRPLTPLGRDEIFSADFLAWLARRQSEAQTDSARLHARRLERQVRGVELLVSRDKLMAGLPTYATYFGRDMLVSALMMRPVWRGAMAEFAIASALRKLSPDGQVSHEEALGGQAAREAAAEYAALLGAGHPDSLARARDVLGHLRRTRENYHMIDDELQLPVLVARWIDDTTIDDAHKRAFLGDSADGGGTRAERLLRELALVARMTAPYARERTAANLIAFAPRDTGWASSSWRDSGAGYAGGRWAMDVNALWAPHALESLGRIVAGFRRLGALPAAGAPAGVGAATPLGTYLRDSLALRAAVEAWRGAWRHFLVTLPAAEARARVEARLAAMPAAERAAWSDRLAGVRADSVSFLALALDAQARPIAVMNTDPATGLFLGGGDDAAVARDVAPFATPYPVGLLVPEAGPVVANDAYATAAVWRSFDRDAYHGPKVVWGREVNLFLLGAAARLAATDPSSPLAARLRAAIADVRAAVARSGFHSELWSYGVQGGRVVPLRYGSGADVQLWSTTDLAVEYVLSRSTR